LKDPEMAGQGGNTVGHGLQGFSHYEVRGFRRTSGQQAVKQHAKTVNVTGGVRDCAVAALGSEVEGSPDRRNRGHQPLFKTGQEGPLSVLYQHQGGLNGPVDAASAVSKMQGTSKLGQLRKQLLWCIHGPLINSLSALHMLKDEVAAALLYTTVV